MIKVNDDDLEYNFEKGLYYYQGIPFTGQAVGCFPDDTLSYETTFINGLHDGIQKRWYPSGKLEAVYHFLKGGGHGTNQEWYESGKIRKEEIIEFGVKIQRIEWDEQGNVTEKYILKESDPVYEILQGRRKKWGNFK